jgi:hypothetical protein
MPFDDAGQRPELNNPNVEELRVVDQMIALLGREGGWTQGQFRGGVDHTSYCLLGALGAVEKGDFLAYRCERSGSPVLDALAFAITGDAFTNRARVVATWNDATGRSQSGVLNLLRRVRAEFE